MKITRIMTKLGVAVSLLAYCGIASAQWAGMTNSPPGNLDTCLLLTDGTAMCHEYNTAHWHRLVPDQFGSYKNGSWDPAGMTIADMPNGIDTSGGCNGPGGCTYAPLYYASAVLADGRVVVIGGEYNPANGNQTETNIGFMYDPVKNTWSNQLTEAFGTGVLGDSVSVILQNKTMVIGNTSGTENMESFNPSTLTFTALNDTGKTDNTNSEEGWVILPSGKVLTVDSSVANSFELYDPTTNQWAGQGTTAGITLPDVGGNCHSIELGPAIQLPNGTVLQFSGAPGGQNAIYDVTAGTWSAAPNSFPVGPGSEGQLTVSDGPASLLPNGHALVMASPGCKATGAACTQNSPGCTCTNNLCYTPFNAPSHLFDWDGVNLNEVTSSGSGFANAGSYKSYQGRMLLLPTGEVLVNAYDQGSTQTVELYTGTGNPDDTWRPSVTSGPNSLDPSTTYSISGTLFNGFSQGAFYGDNAQMATNFPLVRITNQSTGHVFYARTHDHSRMGVEAVGDNETISTSFDTPSDPEMSGLCKLEVVTNGIPSKPWTVNGPGLSVPGPLSMTTCQGSSTSTTLNICNTGKQDLNIDNITSSDPQFSVTNPGYSLVISPDACFPFQVNYTPSGTGTTNATLTVTSNDPNFPTKSVPVTGNSPAPSINATVVNGGNFGSTCPGGQSTLTLQITNQSQCNLVVSNIQSSNSGLFPPPSTSLPLTLTADATVDLPVAFTPTNQQCSDSLAETGTITISSNDATGNSSLVIPVQGTLPCPHINSTFANNGSYGNVCSGNFQDMNLQLLNTGQCNLNISSITSTNSGVFILPGNTKYPLVLSADANVNIPVRFEPTGVCSNTVPQVSTITVNSNDPSFPSLTQNASGIEGCPKLVLSPQNLSGIYAYPATVSDPTGTLGCYTDKQITVSNSGICPLTITSLTTSNGLDGAGLPLPASPLEFSVINPTTPITVAPGAAPVPVTIRFKPQILTDQNSMAPDQQTGLLTIASNDPMAADNSAGLCGEPTYHSGARVLVVDANNNPVSSVAKISLASKGLTPAFSETLQPSPALLGAACGNPIQFHLDNETLKPAGTTGNSPRASYVLSAKNGNTQANMSFTLGQCQVQQIILQIK